MFLLENLVSHAEKELKLVGLDKKDSDYGGLLYKAVLDLIKLFAKQGHSGYSAGMVRQLFNKLANFETLSPISDRKEDWENVSISRDNNKPLWQNKRDPRYFSEDGGKTWWNVDKKDVKECLDIYYHNIFEKRFKSISRYVFESMNTEAEKTSEEIISTVKFQISDEFFENSLDKKKIQDKVTEKAHELLKNAFEKRLSKNRPAGDKIWIVPVFRLEIQFKGKKYPVFFKAEIKNESKFGDDLYAYFFNGVIYKFDIYKDSLAMVIKDKAIRQFNRDYIASKKKPSEALIEDVKDYPYVILLDENGEIVDSLVKKDANYNLYTKEQQFNLSKGRILKIFIPFKSDYLEAEILSIDNEKSYKQDKYFDISFSVKIDGKDQKIKKKLKTDDKVMIEHNDEWILCKIASPFFVLDKRQDNPLNLKYIAVK